MATFYRAEVIGSLLRPAYLKEARQAWEAGKLSTPEFKRAEGRAVNEAIALQEAAGVEVVTDGEMRRSGFVGPLTDVIDGISHPGAEVTAGGGGGTSGGVVVRPQPSIRQFPPTTAISLQTPGRCARSGGG